MSATATTTPTTKSVSAPILDLLIGLAALLLFVIAFILQIQTSEAFILNGSPVTLAANWGVLLQPIQLMQGNLSMNMSKAVMWGWGIEIIFLVVLVGEITYHGPHKGWLKTGAFILIAFNCWADYNYGSLPSGILGQIAFAAITSFIVAFFGIIGVNKISHALHEIAK